MLGFIGQKLIEKAKIQNLNNDILNGQKFMKNAKNGQFWKVFKNLKFAAKQCYQTSHF